MGASASTVATASATDPTSGVASALESASAPALTTAARAGAAIALSPGLIEFAKGTRTLSVYGGFSGQPATDREQLSFGTVGVGYYIWDNFGLNIEAAGYNISQQRQDAAAFGADFLLRHHLVNFTGGTMFVDFGVGVFEADRRVPAGGTDLNFTTRVGVGATLRLTDSTDLLLGTLYMHLSNARQEGPARNPSINAIEGYMGLLFKF
jgi:hypothetical protein